MPLNPSEKKFFENFRKMQESAPQGPSLTEMSLSEHRNIVEGFINNKEYTGEMANVSLTSRAVAVRDGYQVPICIYNSDLKQITAVLIFYLGGSIALSSGSTALNKRRFM